MLTDKKKKNKETSKPTDRQTEKHTGKYTDPVVIPCDVSPDWKNLRAAAKAMYPQMKTTPTSFLQQAENFWQVVEI